MDALFSLWGPTSSMFWVRGVWSVAILLVMVWSAGVASRGIQRALQRAQAHPNASLFAARIVQLSILTLGVILALAILGIDLPALTAFVGLITIALSLSFQDIARSLLAGLYLLIERPFEVGDTIDVGGQQGVIEDVSMRTTILRSANGDRVVVPNLVMFTSTIVQKHNQKENR
ncbi:MAG TPA: mechanosensitive ion channel domain-containing protein [Anaerolineae bacterium]